MGALADLLAKGDGGEASSSPDDGGDPKEMAQASVKAFYEACKSGDYASATDHLASAMEHCGDYGSDGPVEDEGGESGGSPAVMLIAHKK